MHYHPCNEYQAVFSPFRIIREKNKNGLGTRLNLPELQQMIFSNYKNHNTFMGLVGISPDGVIAFVSSLFPGCISDKELTRKSGILDLLKPGDSIMADRGFNIEEDLILYACSGQDG